MKRTSLAAVAASLVLVGCGSEGSEVASDPAASEASATSTPSPTPSPTAAPTVGTYPDFAAEDYAYTLAVSCFCVGAGAPVRITVVGGEVTDAVYTGNGRGVKKGTEAPDERRITINDIIAAANDTGAARVDVDWPSGQDHPTSVYVDQDELMADEEIGYTVSAVVLG